MDNNLLAKVTEVDLVNNELKVKILEDIGIKYNIGSGCYVTVGPVKSLLEVKNETV